MSYHASGKLTLTNDDGKTYEYEVETIGNSMYLTNAEERWHLVHTEERSKARINEQIQQLEFKASELKKTVKEMDKFLKQRKKNGQ